MKLIGYGPKSDHSCFIPKYLKLEDGTHVFASDPCATDKLTVSEFEIPDDYWFYKRDGVVFKFPKSNLVSVRKNLFTEIHGSGDMVPASQRITWLYEMAGILDIDLFGLLSFLNESKKSNENITEAFFRLIKKQ